MSRTCYNAGMIVDADAIVSLVANGMSLRDVAKAHDLMVVDVRTIIDEEAARCFAGAELCRQWLLEARRLRETRAEVLRQGDGRWRGSRQQRDNFH